MPLRKPSAPRPAPDDTDDARRAAEAASACADWPGNRLRLGTLIGGTAIAKAVRAMIAAGVPVAGTDAAEVQFSSMDSIDEGRPVGLRGVKLHILTQGATFNLHTRRADAGALNRPKT